MGPGAGSLRGQVLRGLVPSDAAVSIDAMLERAQRGPAAYRGSASCPVWAAR